LLNLYDVAYSPKLLGYLKVFKKWERTSLSLMGKYTDSMKPNIDLSGFDPTLSGDQPRISAEVDGRFVFDGNFRWKSKKGWFVEASFRNILGKTYNLAAEPLSANWSNFGTGGNPFSSLLSAGKKF